MGFDGNQWAIVALVFVLGWLIGLLSRGGAGRWKRLAREEEARRIAAEDHLAVSNARVAELERDRPIARGTAGAIGAAAAGNRDDLTLIRGIDRSRETRLNEDGIHSYRDLERLTDAEVSTLESRLTLDSGTIVQERWREQAAMLRTEGVDTHRTHYS